MHDGAIQHFAPLKTGCKIDNKGTVRARPPSDVLSVVDLLRRIPNQLLYPNQSCAVAGIVPCFGLQDSLRGTNLENSILRLCDLRETDETNCPLHLLMVHK